MIFFRREIAEHAEIEFRLRRLDRNLVRLAGRKLGQKRIADRLLTFDDRGITEA
jgi:hypothetical protein